MYLPLETYSILWKLLCHKVREGESNEQVNAEFLASQVLP